MARIASHHVNLGWLPCIPGLYNPMTGEPMAQCNSISDQNPCLPGEGPFAEGGYCPAMMPGYPGLLYGGVGAFSTVRTCGPDEDLSGCIVSGGAPAAAPCFIASGPNAGQQVPCPTNSITVTATDPGYSEPATFACPSGYQMVQGVCVPFSSQPAQPFDWNKALLIGGAAVFVLVVIGASQR